MAEVLRIRPWQVQRVPGEPLRVRPAPGRRLTLADVRGEWRMTCTVAACGIFAIAWPSPAGECWAPLHDFALVDQMRMLDICRRHADLNDPERLPLPPRRLV
jgi:hypothetical protein